MLGDSALNSVPHAAPTQGAASTPASSAEPTGHPGEYEYSGTLAIPRELRDQLIALGRAGLPNEACGLAAGASGALARLYPLTNTAASPERYEVDPLEQLTAYQAIEDDGLEIVAVYHSHPATPARPSVTDIAEAHDPNVAYVIVSFAAPEPSVRAFSISDGTVSELTVVITESVAETGPDHAKG